MGSDSYYICPPGIVEARATFPTIFPPTANYSSTYRYLACEVCTRIEVLPIRRQPYDTIGLFPLRGKVACLNLKLDLLQHLILRTRHLVLQSAWYQVLYTRYYLSHIAYPTYRRTGNAQWMPGVWYCIVHGIACMYCIPGITYCILHVVSLVCCSKRGFALSTITFRVTW